MPREKKLFTIELVRVVQESCTLEVEAVSEATAKKRAIALLDGVAAIKTGESQTPWGFQGLVKRPKIKTGAAATPVTGEPVEDAVDTDGADDDGDDES